MSDRLGVPDGKCRRINGTFVDPEFHKALYALTLPWSLAPSSLATMALLQQTMESLHRSRAYMTGQSFAQIVSPVKRLYEALELKGTMYYGDCIYPDPETSSRKGMKISFR